MFVRGVIDTRGRLRAVTPTLLLALLLPLLSGSAPAAASVISANSPSSIGDGEFAEMTLAAAGADPERSGSSSARSRVGVTARNRPRVSITPRTNIGIREGVPTVSG